MKILFVRSPRRYWPYVNIDDNFWMPLNYPCLAASVQQRTPEIEIKAIDCCAERVGWKTLEKMIMEEKADFLGVGEETMYAFEGVRVAEIAKRANPKCIVIGGGRHYPFLPDMYLGERAPFDYLVFGEGEETFAELIEELTKSNPHPENVKGIIFHDGAKIVRTPFRPVIENLDTLPFPAYDIMPHKVYGERGRFWAFKNSIPIQHSRGCISKCIYCSFWPQEAQWSMEGDKPVAQGLYRTKSPEKTVEEMERLYVDYGKRYFNWVDGSFNADSKWSNEWADLVLKKKWKIGWFAFVRADKIVEDDKLGIMEKLVRTGLNYVIIGAERVTSGDLKFLEKKNYDESTSMQASQLINKKYPQIWNQSTYLVGLRNETPESLYALVDHGIKGKIDFPSYHFITPLPGTALWERANREGWIIEKDWSKYDWFNPILKCDNMTSAELTEIYNSLFKRFTFSGGLWIRQLFSRYGHKRNIALWLTRVALRFQYAEIKQKLGMAGQSMTSRVPVWYES